MEALIEQYKTWLVANSKSKKTIYDYIFTIKWFLKATQLTNINMISEKIINEYVAGLQTKYKQRTINFHISAIKSFLDFNNIFLRVPKSKEPPRKVIKIVTEYDLEYKIFPMVEREMSNCSLRYKAVLAFLYYAGLRITDASKVKRSQINLDSNLAIVIISKQNLEKEILIPMLLKNILIKYFASEGEENGAFNMNAGQIKNLFTRLKPMLPELELHPHKFRKSYATNAHRLGMKLEEVQEMLGHKNIATTQIYVQPPTSEEIRKKYLKLELEKLKQAKRGNHDKPQS